MGETQVGRYDQSYSTHIDTKLSVVRQFFFNRSITKYEFFEPECGSSLQGRFRGLECGNDTAISAETMDDTAGSVIKSR